MDKLAMAIVIVWIVIWLVNAGSLTVGLRTLFAKAPTLSDKVVKGVALALISATLSLLVHTFGLIAAVSGRFFGDWDIWMDVGAGVFMWPLCVAFTFTSFFLLPPKAPFLFQHITDSCVDGLYRTHQRIVDVARLSGLIGVVLYVWFYGLYPIMV